VPNASFRYRLLVGCEVLSTTVAMLVRPMWTLEAFAGLAVAVGVLWLWMRAPARCFFVFVRLAAGAATLLLVVAAVQGLCTTAKPLDSRSQSAQGQPSEHYYKDKMKQTLQRAASRARQ
jgi:hypothetical protein